ncbi:pseudouridine synthase [Stenotrophomonas pictorum]|uniref:pseudouridine synthase n=1 Tax=Stenotrophomonas pictorum TaxID=86184 RepID=UPI000B1E737E|nr:pseudouridine synthase [Stenotrophomonas pictorum]
MPDPDLPSRLQLAPGSWACLLDGLCARFPQVSRAQWLDRFARGRVLSAGGVPLMPQQPWRAGLEIQYFREVSEEPRIPFVEQVLYQDEDLLVADKPHFLPVMPAGQYVRETLLTRLVAATGNRDLVPLHRIDRGTAGLVLFSCNRRSRAAYQRLFRDRRIDKGYEARALALPQAWFPLERASRIERGEPFFRMAECAGEPNSLSRISVIERTGAVWRYALEPVTGRKHQLRVHMAALGAPILGDDIYPQLVERAVDDYRAPLQLLARCLAFVDPLSGRRREFCSERTLG